MSRQRGHVRKEGRTWRLVLRQTDESGDRKRKSVSLGTIEELPTRAAARRAADRVLERLDPRQLNAGTVVQWSTWCDRYVERWLARHAKNTQATQGSIIAAHLRDAFTGPVHAIDKAAVQDFVGRQMKAGAAKSTIAARFAVLRRMLRQAEEEGLAATPPTLRQAALPKDEEVSGIVRQKSFTEDECRRIFAAASVRDATAFMLARYLGLRGSELLGLTWSLIDLTSGAITVRQQALDGQLRPLKTKGSAAVLQAPAELLDCLRSYWEGFEPGYQGLLFPDAAFRPESSQALRERLHGYLDTLGLRRRGLHGFRHACALAMADAGCNPEVIRRAMRHSSLRVTAIYLSAAPEDIAAGLARGANMARGRSVATPQI